MMVPQCNKGTFCLIALLFSVTVIAKLATTEATAQNTDTPAQPDSVVVAQPQAKSDTDRTVLIYDAFTSQSDRGFIDSARQGAERARTEEKVAYSDIRVGADTEREQQLTQALSKGAKNIVAVGFQYVIPVLKLAEAYPNVRFTVIDGVVPPIFPNVQSVLFKDNEGAFLVGMIAAHNSKTGTIGFVGGMDVPLIHNFAYGYRQGAKYVNPNIIVKVNTIGIDKSAWSNPEKGYELANKQFEEGADVVFAAAGGSGLGVLRAAKDKGKFAIGVDSNQNGLYPGTVLTSMVKRVDKAVFDSLKSLHDDSWKPGIKYLGIHEAALDYAIDNHNRDLISAELIDKVEDAKDLIIRGMIEVEVYSPQ